MIKLSIKNNKIIINVEEQSDKRQLEKPLHRLYLKSTLSGSYNQEYSICEVPLYHDDDLQLDRLLSHFKKYNITFDFDNSINNILKELDLKKQEFKKVLEAGLKTRSNILKNRKTEILSFLRKTFVRIPTDVQLKAIDHLINVKNGANFSVPGSGKTTIALAYFEYLRQNNIINSLFIIGPISSFEPWEREYIECFGNRPNSIRIAGNKKQDRQHIYLTARNYDMLLTSYHSIIHDVSDIINCLKRNKYLIILDESHYIKNPKGGKISEAVLKITKYADRRIILTGTPMPNSLSDLWSQFTFLWPNNLPLGTAESYLSFIQNTDQFVASEEIKKIILPLFNRITKNQLGLPKPKFNIIQTELTPLQKRIYHGISKKYLTEITRDIEERNTLRQFRKARGIRLLQVASNPGLLKQYCEEFLIPPLESANVSLTKLIDHYYKYEIPSKFNVLKEFVPKLIRNGEKVLIWSNFIFNLKTLKDIFKQFNPIVIYGGVPHNSEIEEFNREYLINQFKYNKECMLMIANPAACAESISLHKVCHNAIYLDRSFNCAHYIQSLDRIHRLGLKQSDIINYYILIAKDTIDEVINDRLLEKLENMKNIIEGDLPLNINGFWDEDLGVEEEIDFDLVEKHIKAMFKNDN